MNLPVNSIWSRLAGAALVVAIFLALGMARPAEAQIGGSAVVFLQIEPDSRAAGMGNTGVALADNAYASFWNPAGLAFQQGLEASLTHSTWLPEFNAGLYYEYLVGKYHLPGWGTFGGHVTFLNLGEHERTDASGNRLGTFRSYDLAVGGSYATQLTDEIALGGGLRMIYSNLAQGEVGTQKINPGISAAFDLGALYRSAPFALGNVETTVSAGLNLANMGPQIQYSDTEQADPIPTNIRLGYALTFDLDEYNRITLANDFNKMLIRRDSVEADPFYKAIFSSWQPIQVNQGTVSEPNLQTLSVFDQFTIGAGLEYWYNQLFALRSGYFYENPYNGNREFLTFGAGLRYNIVGVDFSYIYAMEENSPLANTMRFSLLLNFAQ
ncbi:MAG: type IX secretion system outer membrane channel protein PorV [Bacteroidota bacterium]